MRDIWIYIAVMSAVTIAIRLTPALLLRREIKNVFVRSFLFYVPYVTLSVMTFPAIVEATRTPLAGAAARPDQFGARRGGGQCGFVALR